MFKFDMSTMSDGLFSSSKGLYIHVLILVASIITATFAAQNRRDDSSSPLPKQQQQQRPHHQHSLNQHRRQNHHQRHHATPGHSKQPNLQDQNHLLNTAPPYPTQATHQHQPPLPNDLPKSKTTTSKSSTLRKPHLQQHPRNSHIKQRRLKLWKDVQGHSDLPPKRKHLKRNGRKSSNVNIEHIPERHSASSVIKTQTSARKSYEKFVGQYGNEYPFGFPELQGQNLAEKEEEIGQFDQPLIKGDKKDSFAAAVESMLSSLASPSLPSLPLSLPMSLSSSSSSSLLHPPQSSSLLSTSSVDSSMIKSSKPLNKHHRNPNIQSDGSSDNVVLSKREKRRRRRMKQRREERKKKMKMKERRNKKDRNNNDNDDSNRKKRDKQNEPTRNKNEQEDSNEIVDDNMDVSILESVEPEHKDKRDRKKHEFEKGGKVDQVNAMTKDVKSRQEDDFIDVMDAWEDFSNGTEADQPGTMYRGGEENVRQYKESGRDVTIYNGREANVTMYNTSEGNVTKYNSDGGDVTEYNSGGGDVTRYNISEGGVRVGDTFLQQKNVSLVDNDDYDDVMKEFGDELNRTRNVQHDTRDDGGNESNDGDIRTTTTTATITMMTLSVDDDYDDVRNVSISEGNEKRIGDDNEDRESIEIDAKKVIDEYKDDNDTEEKQKDLSEDDGFDDYDNDDDDDDEEEEEEDKEEGVSGNEYEFELVEEGVQGRNIGRSGKNNNSNTIIDEDNNHNNNNDEKNDGNISEEEEVGEVESESWMDVNKIKTSPLPYHYYYSPSDDEEGLSPSPSLSSSSPLGTTGIFATVRELVLTVKDLYRHQVDSRSKIKALERRHEDQVTDLDLNRGRIRTLEHKVENMDATVEKLDLAVAGVRQEMANLRNRQQKAEAGSRRLRSNFGRLSTQLKTLSDWMDGNTEKEHVPRSDLNMHRGIEGVKEIGEDLTELKDTFERLEGRVDKLERVDTRLSKRIYRINKEFDKLGEMVEEVKGNSTRLTEEVKDLRSEVEDVNEIVEISMDPELVSARWGVMEEEGIRKKRDRITENEMNREGFGKGRNGHGNVEMAKLEVRGDEDFDFKNVEINKEGTGNVDGTVLPSSMSTDSDGISRQWRDLTTTSSVPDNKVDDEGDDADDAPFDLKAQPTPSITSNIDSSSFSGLQPIFQYGDSTSAPTVESNNGDHNNINDNTNSRDDDTTRAITTTKTSNTPAPDDTKTSVRLFDDKHVSSSTDMEIEITQRTTTTSNQSPSTTTQSTSAIDNLKISSLQNIGNTDNDIKSLSRSTSSLSPSSTQSMSSTLSSSASSINTPTSDTSTDSNNTVTTTNTSFDATTHINNTTDTSILQYISELEKRILYLENTTTAMSCTSFKQEISDNELEIKSYIHNQTKVMKENLDKQDMRMETELTSLKKEVDMTRAAVNNNRSEVLEEKIEARDLQIRQIQLNVDHNEAILSQLVAQVSSINMSEFLMRLRESLTNFTRNVVTVEQWKEASERIVNVTLSNKASIARLDKMSLESNQATTSLKDKVTFIHSTTKRWYRSLQGHMIRLNNSLQDFRERMDTGMAPPSVHANPSQPPRSQEFQSRVDNLHIQLLINSNRLSGIEGKILNKSLEFCKRSTIELRQAASILRLRDGQKSLKDNMMLQQEKTQRVDLTLLRLLNTLKTNQNDFSRMTSHLAEMSPMKSQVLRLEKEVERLLLQVPKDCQEYYERGFRVSGLYVIVPDHMDRSVRVYCIMVHHVTIHENQGPTRNRNRQPSNAQPSDAPRHPTRIENHSQLEDETRTVGEPGDNRDGHDYGHNGNDMNNSITDVEYDRVSREITLEEYQNALVIDDVKEDNVDNNKINSTESKNYHSKFPKRDIGDTNSQDEEGRQINNSEILSDDGDNNNNNGNGDVDHNGGVVEDSTDKWRIYDNGGWTVIQRRMDGTVNFSRPWLEYASGFGRIKGEHWLGNDIIHFLTSQNDYEIKIVMEDTFGGVWEARYDVFKVDNRETGYRLKVKGYHGNASDGFGSSDQMAFSTVDRDEDASSSHCALYGNGGWWYRHCHISNLNGPFNVGVVWFNKAWQDWVQMRSSVMMVRPRKKVVKNKKRKRMRRRLFG